ncbi:GroES-like protein [Venustampulla echinocandica]|uniref:GroES-like protein n=1 Tax=Venustampulla echinocandica TaxID=2656787 RepID=A0A370TK55_9HELO|nr:GroES-like protein [Venustampulla echinocandica]RDL35906.1 GroES-like protein [Venustampulla echinocandica]
MSGGNTMRALQLSKTGDTQTPNLSLQTLPKPAITPGHLLVKVHASAIQPSDLINAKGGFPSTTYPRIPGRDFSGVIVDGAANRIGQEVYGTSGNAQGFTVDGAQAEYILVPEDAVATKPRALSFVQAATVGVPFTTAATVLKRSGAQQDDVVLILGANGAVGSAAVQLAKCKGCRVLEGSRHDNADVNTAKDPDLKTVDSLTAGKGVNVVIDTVGQPALTQAAIGKLAKGGTLVFISGPRTGARDLTFDMVDFYRLSKTIIGVNTLTQPAREFAKELQYMSEMFDSKLLTVSGNGGEKWAEMKLDDGVEAYEKAGQRGAGKFVIVME